MKKYLNHFKVWLILLALVAVAFFIIVVPKLGESKEVIKYTRANTQCDTTCRVFDEADVLTDMEESALQEEIEKCQEKIGCDIVLVTVSNPDLNTDNKMMRYADAFYEQHKFGYNRPYKDGFLLLDNDLGPGNSLTWMLTAGRGEDRINTDYEINEILNRVFDVVNSNHYAGYLNYVQGVTKKMSRVEGMLGLGIVVSPYSVFVCALVATIIYVFAAIRGNGGKRTTDATTYVAGHTPNFSDHRDIFLHKHTTSHRIESSSSGGGGGGHHISAGGHSFGGGGGRH